MNFFRCEFCKSKLSVKYDGCSKKLECIRKRCRKVTIDFRDGKLSSICFSHKSYYNHFRIEKYNGWNLFHFGLKTIKIGNFALNTNLSSIEILNQAKHQYEMFALFG